jgi:hypothetical protein
MTLEKFHNQNSLFQREKWIAAVNSFSITFEPVYKIV